MNLDEILEAMITRRASDCHLKVGRPPLFRVSGELLPTEYPSLEEEEISAALDEIMSPAQKRALAEELDCDFSHSLPGKARFRVNAFHQRGKLGAVFRLIPLTIPTVDSLKLPPVLKDICQKPQGLVIVTGPTGSGKTTTLAALIDHIVKTRAVHVMTVEDPIEFVYYDGVATVNQRQLGTDTPNLHEALRRVLRQDPDVILLGEMRDRATMEMALHAAETGHLVFSTLHTNDAKQSVDRIVDSFPGEGHKQLLKMLSLSLAAIISQRLLRRSDGHGRVAALEIMINSPNIRQLLEEGKTLEIEKAIATSTTYYRMQTFNQALAHLVFAKTVSEEEALETSPNPDDLRLLLKGIRPAGETAQAAVSIQPPAPVAPPPARPSVPTPRPAGTPAPAAAPAAEAPRPKISRGFQF
ncbi:MAG: type IV pilus twitching motility protein PilT [Planctomycetales bacterium]|nr:type IV pilus twitching motility protein PilT [Planctomycetales bacterium]